MKVRQLSRDIFVGLIVSGAVLLFLEAIARLAVTVRDDLTTESREQPAAEEPWVSYSPTLGWVNKRNFSGETVGGAQRNIDSEGYFSVDAGEVNDATLKRVLFVGDSNTFGFGVESRDTFAEVAEALLPGTAAINLGVPGYSSYQGRIVLEKYLPIVRPDLVVVSFNFNDRRYSDVGGPDGPETFLDLFMQSQVGAHAYAPPFLEKVYLFRALRSLMRRAGLLSEPAPTSVSLDTLRPRVDGAGYRENLERMAAIARQAGVPLIFVLLMDNPIESYHTRMGEHYLARQDYRTAINHLEIGTQSFRFDALARLTLARAYRATGAESRQVEETLSFNRRGSVMGGVVIRPDTEYNEIMREVAQREEVTLVDATQVLAEHAGTFIDYCHFNAEGHRLVGELLAPTIGKILSVTPVTRAGDQRSEIGRP